MDEDWVPEIRPVGDGVIFEAMVGTWVGVRVAAPATEAGGAVVAIPGYGVGGIVVAGAG